MASKRAPDWTDEEIRVLLEVAAEMRLYQILDGKRHRHKNVYMNLSTQLHERGVDRNGDQCKVKLKNLRGEFNKRRRCLAVSGGAALDPLAHQDLLEDMFGTRPSANAPAMAFDATFNSMIPEELEPVSDSSSDVVMFRDGGRQASTTGDDVTTLPDADEVHSTLGSVTSASELSPGPSREPDDTAGDAGPSRANSSSSGSTASTASSGDRTPAAVRCPPPEPGRAGGAGNPGPSRARSISASTSTSVSGSVRAPEATSLPRQATSGGEGIGHATDGLSSTPRSVRRRHQRRQASQSSSSSQWETLLDFMKESAARDVTAREQEAVRERDALEISRGLLQTSERYTSQLDRVVDIMADVAASLRYQPYRDPPRRQHNM